MALARANTCLAGRSHTKLKNESYISYADLALAIIDELKNKKFIQKRFTAVGERA